MTLLVRDFEGYQNLCRLSSRGYTEGHYHKPRSEVLQGREADAKARLL